MIFREILGLCLMSFIFVISPMLIIIAFVKVVRGENTRYWLGIGILLLLMMAGFLSIPNI
jgi:hypothetical protein